VTIGGAVKQGQKNAKRSACLEGESERVGCCVREVWTRGGGNPVPRAPLGGVDPLARVRGKGANRG